MFYNLYLLFIIKIHFLNSSSGFWGFGVLGFIIEFIKEILEARENIFDISDIKAFIVLDNAFIHDGAKAKEFT